MVAPTIIDFFQGKEMSILIVGADRIGSLLPKLKAIGAQEIVHWSGRNNKASKRTIPVKTELVIFCTDFLQHNAARTLKKQIKERGLPAIYCRRAWSEIAPEIEQYFPSALTGEKVCRKGRGCQDCPQRQQHNLN